MIFLLKPSFKDVPLPPEFQWFILLDLVRWFCHASLVWPDRARRAAYTEAGGLRPQEVRIGMMVLLGRLLPSRNQTWKIHENTVSSSMIFLVEPLISNGFPSLPRWMTAEGIFCCGESSVKPWSPGKRGKETLCGAASVHGCMGGFSERNYMRIVTQGVAGTGSLVASTPKQWLTNRIPNGQIAMDTWGPKSEDIQH